MLLALDVADADEICLVVNDAAAAYRGVIPADRWKEPYMPLEEVHEEKGAGVGSALLEHLRRQTDRPLLVGTWRAATWAVRFYERRGFRLVSDEEKARLLKRYWTVPERQISESVVLRSGRRDSVRGK